MWKKRTVAQLCVINVWAFWTLVKQFENMNTFYKWSYTQGQWKIGTSRLLGNLWVILFSFFLLWTVMYFHSNVFVTISCCWSGQDSQTSVNQAPRIFSLSSIWSIQVFAVKWDLPQINQQEASGIIPGVLSFYEAEFTLRATKATIHFLCMTWARQA